jgi:iron complex transport system ATP-binding protein
MTREGYLFSLSNVSFAYGQRPVISGISLDISEGELVGIIGPNGAGKSTLLRLLAGYLGLRSGCITFLGQDLGAYDKKALAKQIATLPQSIDTPFSYGVEEFILMGRYPHADRKFFYSEPDRRFVADIMETLKIGDLAGRPIDTLSQGEKQKVHLAQCIAQNPRVLLLDEPVSHLDIKYQLRTLEMLEALHHDGLTVLLVLHDLNLAGEFCTRIILLSKGQVYADGPPRLVLTFQNIEAVYDTVVIVKENPVSGRPFVVPVSTRYLKPDRE